MLLYTFVYNYIMLSWTYDVSKKYFKSIKMPFEIESGLFLGNLSDAKSANDFDLVINCTPDVPFAACVPEAARLRIPLRDNDEYREQIVLISYVVDNGVLQKIDDVIQGGGRVLVHSFMGFQRSCAVVAAYLMMKRHWDWYTALAHIKAIRPSFENCTHFRVGLSMLDMHFKRTRSV